MSIAIEIARLLIEAEIERQKTGSVDTRQDATEPATSTDNRGRRQPDHTPARRGEQTGGKRK